MSSKEKFVQEIYTEKIDLYHNFFNGLFRYKHGVNAFYTKMGYLQPNMKILDAGCGSGIQTINLYNVAKEKNIENLQFNGFDITPAMLEMFNKWIIQNKVGNVEIKQANVIELDRLPNSWKDYDLIVSSAMMEYLTRNEIKQALRNLKKLLKPNGKFVLCITKKNILMKVLIEMWWDSTSYKKKEIKEIFHEVGFNQVEFKSFPSPYLHLNLWGHIIEATND